ncbi:MAG TPA: V-type ATP synthase subunit F [Clostridia bacterium]
MYKIAVIGDKDSIAGFAALGMRIFPANDGNEAKELLRKLSSSDYAIIYITEELAEHIPDEIEKYKEMFSPAVILIPGILGGTGMGLASISSMVEKAVGVDIFK